MLRNRKTFCLPFLFLLTFFPLSAAFAIDRDVEEVLLKNFQFSSSEKKFFSASVYNKNKSCLIEFAYSAHTGDYMLSLHRIGKIGIGIDMKFFEKRGDTLVYVEPDVGNGSWKGTEIFLDTNGIIEGFKNSGSKPCDMRNLFPVKLE